MYLGNTTYESFSEYSNRPHEESLKQEKIVSQDADFSLSVVLNNENLSQWFIFVSFA